MFTDIITRIKKLFGKDAVSKSELEQINELGYVIKYEDVTEFNIVSVIANKLANIVCSEAGMEIVAAADSEGTGIPLSCGTSPFCERGQGERDKNKNGKIGFLNGGLQKCVTKLHLIAARAFGTGGVVLKPYICGGAVYIDIIPQNRFFVVERKGEVITKAGFVADVFYDEKAKKTYARIEYHSLGPDRVCTIENKAAVVEKNKESVEVALSKTVWADMPQSVSITNVEQMLFAFVRCPSDNKKESGSANGGMYGVPITYGQDKLIKMILGLLNEIPDEYGNKKAFIGADDLLFDKETAPKGSRIASLSEGGVNEVDGGSKGEPSMK